MSGKGPRRSIYSNPTLEDALKGRVSEERGVSATITEIVRRYVAICEDELEGSVAIHMTDADWRLLVDSYAAQPIDPVLHSHDVLRSFLGPVRIADIGTSGLCAVIDSLERMRVADPPPRTTLETVRIALGQLLEEQGAEPVREVLGLFDCRQASELRASDYAAVIRKAEERLKR